MLGRLTRHQQVDLPRILGILRLESGHVGIFVRPLGSAGPEIRRTEEPDVYRVCDLEVTTFVSRLAQHTESP